jgi:DDE superfamily endonuclease
VSACSLAERLERLENCQVGVFLSYVTACGHTLIDRELYLPLDWCEDRERCRTVGIPETVRFQTKPELAIRMIERLWKAAVPTAWVVADTVYGGNLDLRNWLETHQYPYVLAVPCNEPVGILTRDGQRRRVEVWEVEALLLGAQDWQRLSMSEGTKGPRLFDWAVVPILHHWEDDGHHWLLIRRSLTDPNEKAYSFVFAPKGTTLPEMVAAIGARWHIEEDAGKRQRAGAGPLRSSVLHRLVPIHHAGAGGSCLLNRDLCARAVLPLSPCSISASRSTCRACPDRPRSAPSPCTAHLALFIICLSGSGLVVVASLPSKSCQLLPQETSSQGWLILAGPHSSALGFVL